MIRVMAVCLLVGIVLFAFIVFLWLTVWPRG